MRRRPIADSSRRSGKTRSGGITSAWISGLIGLLSGSHAIPIKRSEINRLKHQRRKAAIAGRGGDDFSCERKLQSGALDHDHRLEAFGRHVEDAKNPGIEQLETEQHEALDLRLAVEPQRHFEVVFGEGGGLDTDIDLDRGLLRAWCQSARRVRVLE